MLERFKTHIQNNFSFLMGKRLLLACSGGLDSVVLAHLSVWSDLDVTLAHCNFNLRGEESDGDELFVRNLADELKTEVEVKPFNTQEQVQLGKGSVQMVARKLRYHWFNELMDDKGFDYILTAHHTDDNLETFLINLSRGTGLDGLSGIPAQNDKVIRLLLNFSRNEILDYAQKEKIKWRDDSSNQDNKYLRNKIRLEIVPQLKELHPTFLENFKQTQTYLHQTSAIVEQHIEALKKSLFKREGDRFEINIERLRELQPVEAYLYQLFNTYGFTEWGDVKQLLTAMSGKEVHSKTHRLLKDREYLILSKMELDNKETYFVSEKKCNVETPVPLKMDEVKTIGETSKNTIFLDKEKLNYPLILRNWEKGDYFYPFGMQGKKKISKFFKDEKMDVLSKEKQWLLCSGNNIVWVIGKRLDERFKVDDSTKTILKITLSV
ncbi:tRNA(Ile)-lysidine synthase [Flagellimonas pacifica]|uniref:tRNA(Ile)-lysidine synthase n=2 Tax=Flagellimonas pacifica TaxID=1247520 RepID=A0A285MSE3_9FLAO|nr:tRNA(Ile)-lysidine synthase [Allomuricauda parva]